MPFLGFVLGSAFYKYITAFDHWIAFVLLAFIGGKMIKEAFSDEEENADTDASFGAVTMLVMAIATSIDALAVGITFAFLNVKYMAGYNDHRYNDICLFSRRSQDRQRFRRTLPSSRRLRSPEASYLYL